MKIKPHRVFKIKSKIMSIIATSLALLMLFVSCRHIATDTAQSDDESSLESSSEAGLTTLPPSGRPSGQEPPIVPPTPQLPPQQQESSQESSTEGSESYGGSLEDTGALDGYFESPTTDGDYTVTCVAGTPNSYKIEGDTLTFTTLNEDSVYSVSGKLAGNIVIDVGDTYKLELELSDFTLVSTNTNPIIILSGDKVSIQAKKDTSSYIYDKRAKIDETDESLYSGAIWSKSDLEISGKGTLNIVSDNNNGIHSKDDLKLKNLTLVVSCVDNALKGNDSVEISDATLTLIATAGDGIKTVNSDISDSGKQRGDVTLCGGSCDIYAACDGIDAAYDVVVEDGTVLNIYTDKYSGYSSDVTESAEEVYYIRFSSKSYTYSIKYYNSDSDYLWLNAEYHSSVSGGRTTYYYYTFPKNEEYEKLQLFVYSSGMVQGQEEEYYLCSDYMSHNDAYDTISLSSRGGSVLYGWTNYTTSSQGGMGGFGGMGGMSDGNTDKGTYSTKGIKSSNEIIINGGSIGIRAYDDAIHAGGTATLENEELGIGNLTINGGALTLYSNDDGLHADGALTISAGTVKIENSYEGVEGTTVNISGGSLAITSKDDGINSTVTSGTGISISGGYVYIYCTGDGIDSNSRSSYAGISFSGGRTVVISNSNGNSAIDSEAGYSYTGGTVVAIMPRGGMSGEATNASNFSSVGTSKSVALTSGEYLVTKISSVQMTIKIPCSLSAYVIMLGDSSATATTTTDSASTLDDSGVAWE